MLRRLVAVLLCLFASPLAAQPGGRAAGASLRGVVRDSSGAPIAGAQAAIDELSRATRTDAEGHWSFADVPAGRYRLAIRRAGYSPVLQVVSAPTMAPLEVVLRTSSLRLEALTVTATRAGRDPDASPLSFAAISGERLRREHEVSLAHALDGLAGVRTLSTGEQTGKPIIRGLTGPRVLVLDNGLRSDDFSWSDEDGPAIDSRLAQRIEVIRGPASVLYGSDALGGVINVVADELPDARGSAAFVRSSIEGYFGSNKNDIGGLLRAEGGRGAIGWRATIVGRQAGNIHAPPGAPDTPTGELYDTDFATVNGELALGVHGEKASATLRYERYGGNFGLLDGPPVVEDNREGPRRRLADDRVQLSSNWLLGEYRLETRSQWQGHSMQEVVGESRAGLAPAIFDLRLSTFSTDVLLHHAASEWLTGTIGVSGLWQDNRSTGQVPLVPDARTSGFAVFALEQATHGAWSVLAGLRADTRSVSAAASPALGRVAQVRDQSAVTGQVGLGYHAGSGVSLTANLGRAFRAPTLYELFTDGPHLGENRWEVGLPGAKPEESTNAEVGARWQGRHARLEVSVYKNQIDNFLYIQATGDTVTFINPDKGDTLALPRFRHLQTARATLRGIDATFEAEATPWLTLRGRADFVHGVNEVTREYLPALPPFRFDLETEWHASGVLGARHPYVNVAAELVDAQSRVGPFDEPTAAFGLLHLGMGGEYAIGGRSLTIDLRLRNALNSAYHNYLSRYKTFAFEQGRNLTLRLSMGL